MWYQGTETAIFRVRYDTLTVDATIRVDGGEKVKYRLVFKRAQG